MDRGLILPAKAYPSSPGFGSPPLDDHGAHVSREVALQDPTEFSGHECGPNFGLF
jgi:hypothetical protein